MKYFLNLLLLAAFGHAGAQYKYVSPAGSNANTGSAALPWQTIQHAMENAIPGDTVLILTGTYTEALDMGVSGTASANITFRATNADSVTVDGSGLNADYLLRINNRHYITIEGICFKNNIHNDAVGVMIDNASHHVALHNCSISQIHFSADAAATVTSSTNSNPLLVYGNSADSTYTIQITGCKIFNCRTGYSEGLSVDGNVSLFEISHNVVHDISNIGIDVEGNYGVSPDIGSDQARYGICSNNVVFNCQSPYAAAAGIYVDGGRDCKIDGNTIYNCQYGIEVGCEKLGYTTAHIVVANNFIYNNTDAGIAFGGYDYPTNTGKVISCRFYNNSTFNNTAELNITYAENCVVRNNIFYSTDNKLLYCEPDSLQHNTFDYNCWYQPTGATTAAFEYAHIEYEQWADYLSASRQDAHSIFADPDYADTAAVSIKPHILSNSPCINAGDLSVSAYVGTYDINSNARIQGSNIDIGASELAGPTGIFPTLSVNTIAVYPNPAHGQFTVFFAGIGDGPGTFQLFSIWGVKVFEGSLHSGSNTFARRPIVNGAYIWRISERGSSLAVGHLVLD